MLDKIYFYSSIIKLFFSKITKNGLGRYVQIFFVGSAPGAIVDPMHRLDIVSPNGQLVGRENSDPEICNLSDDGLT